MPDLTTSKTAAGSTARAGAPVRKPDMATATDNAIRFGFLVHDVSRLRRIVVDRELRPLGVTRSQWWVLAFLSRRDGMTQTALAADLDLTKVAVGGLLGRMEAAVLVQRRFDESDARIRRVYLSRAGTRAVRDIRKRVQQIELEILGSNSEEDIQMTVRTLHRMKMLLLQKIGEEE
jgi:DNA-binding MarR family transcriptional regulator